MASDGAAIWPRHFGRIEILPDAAKAGETEASFEGSVDAGWLDEAVCACSFVGDPGGSPASDAVKVLDDAGIPCEVTAVEISSALDRHLAQYEHRVMVPAPLNLKARSILARHRGGWVMPAEEREQPTRLRV